MMIRRTVLVGVFLACVAPVAALPHPGFRFVKPIELPPGKDDEIVAIPLDADVFAHTRDQYPDLRVVDDRGSEVPYQIEPDVEYREERRRKPLDVEVVSLKEQGNSIDVRLRLRDGHADGLRFKTPLINFERTVRIFGSADGADWKPLVPDGVLFDYSRFMDVRNDEIALPKNTFREFKIAIEDITDEKESPLKEMARTFRGAKEDQRVEKTIVERRPFRIDRIEAWQDAVQERIQRTKTTVYPMNGFETKDDPAKKQTIITIRTQREPLTRLTLATPSRNFFRRAAVEAETVRKNAADWLVIGRGTIFNYRLRQQPREELALSFPERRAERLRIIIDNDDNPPLAIDNVKAEGPVLRLVFVAQPNRSYRLCYGSETAELPKYDVAAVLGNLRQDAQPILGKLGPQSENPLAAAAPTNSLRDLLNNWIFLGTAIGLMVAALGWTLFRAGRKLDGLSKE